MIKRCVSLLVILAFLTQTCREIGDIEPNHPPVAKAGNDQSTIAGTLINLDGSASADTDQDLLSYSWQLISKPLGSVTSITYFDSVKANFIPDIAGLYSIRLLVTDNIGTAADTILITSTNRNHPPEAKAGNDKFPNTGVVVMLDGSASSDFDGDKLSFAWQFISKPTGSSTTINLADSSKANFTPDIAGTYHIKLLVTDSKATAEDTILVTAQKVGNPISNKPPIAKAGNNQSTYTGTSVSLDGSASSDPDGDKLSFTWTFISKPAGSTTSINLYDSAKSNFIPDLAGTYTIKLVVTDNIATSSDTLSVEATVQNNAPIADAGKDGTANLGSQYQLAGNGTDPNNDPLTYSWSFVSKPLGSTATLSNSSVTNPTFTVDRPGVFILRLLVADSQSSSQDDVTITTNPVTITSINPVSGPLGITVKIIGQNFSNAFSENLVKFNGVTAVVTSASYTEILATVPIKAGTGVVTATVNGVTATGPVFTYIPSPVVSTVQQFNRPIYVASDANGNIYIADYDSHVIRLLNTKGELTIIAGNGQPGFVNNNKALQAQFNHPAGIALDAAGNIYVADNGNHSIRKITVAGVVTTLAGNGQAGFANGTGALAQFNSPIGLCIDGSGNLYVGDAANVRIRRVTSTGSTTTFAGNGQSGFLDGAAATAQFNGITGLAFYGGYVYVADAFNNRIRRINGQGIVSTFAGTGTAGLVNGAATTTAQFKNPYGVAADTNGNIYVADFSNHSIRLIASGAVTTFAGTGTSGFVDGPAATAKFNSPTGIVITSGKVYVADYGNTRIRLIVNE